MVSYRYVVEQTAIEKFRTMRRIILAPAIAAIPLPAAAVCMPNAFGSVSCNDPSDLQQRNNPIQSSRNIYGGFDYSNGWSSREERPGWDVWGNEVSENGNSIYLLKQGG